MGDKMANIGLDRGEMNDAFKAIAERAVNNYANYDDAKMMHVTAYIAEMSQAFMNLMERNNQRIEEQLKARDLL